MELIEKQLEILKKEMIGEGTDAELREYDEREERIEELRNAIRWKHPGAELPFRITIEPAHDFDGSPCHQPPFESEWPNGIVRHCHLVKWKDDGPVTTLAFVISRRGS